MKATLANYQTFAQKRSIALSALLIGLGCVVVYLANNQTISSNDNVPHSLLAFNWLEDHTLNLDAFRGSYHFNAASRCDGCEGNTPYFFAEAPNGHLTSTYPIGTALVTFPLYGLFFIYLKLAALIQTGSANLNITDVSFEPHRLYFEKLAGTIATALSAVIFYLGTRLKFNQAIALITTFIYAFCTSSWSLSSQGLRQHTVFNLLILAVILCLFKANRTEGKRQKVLLLVAGFFCGLLPGVRLTSLVFTVAAIAYVLFTYRKRSLFFALGLPSALFSIAWNAYYFGIDNIAGGYSNLGASGSWSYRFTIAHFTTAFFGLLISPNEGAFVFSPILLFAIPGLYLIVRRRAGRDEQLLGCLAIACLILFTNYCFFQPWTGGSGSFGPRFMIDILPVFCYAIAYFIAALQAASKSKQAGIVAVMSLCVLLSVSIQSIGAFSKTNWGLIPVPLRSAPERIWQIQDSQIQRGFNNILYTHWLQPIDDPDDYLPKLSGEIQQIQIADQPIATPLIVEPRQQIILKAKLQNTGSASWFGYETGMTRGETRIKVEFLSGDRVVQTRLPNRLFVSGSPQPNSEATAIGRVMFPQKPGEYRMVLKLVVERLGDFPPRSSAEVPVVVQRRS